MPWSGAFGAGPGTNLDMVPATISSFADSACNGEFWGVDVNEDSGLVYGPFKHAFKCIAKYVSAAWKIRNAYAHPSDVA